MQLLDLKKFNQWLYDERDAQEVSQNQLEKASGISHVMISKYENGADIRLSNMVRLLDALGYDTVVMIRRKMECQK